MPERDSRIRSVLKALSWRIIATLTTVLISLIITGNMRFAISIGAFEMISKIVLYYVHERLWEKVKA